MKSSVKLLFVFGIIFAGIIGLFIGLSFKIGKVNEIEVSGTIAKINNYRKTQSSITATEISNQLLSDTARLKNMQNISAAFFHPESSNPLFEVHCETVNFSAT